MSDEDDYMSDKFLGSSSKEESSLPKLKKVKREHELFKKKEQNKPIPLRLKEKQLRTEALSTAISSDNKGFQMLAKMGYKPGTGLGKSSEGIVEPINVIIKEDKMAVGAKRNLEEKRQRDTIKLQHKEKDFRKALAERERERRLARYFKKAQTCCWNLDQNSGVDEPLEKFYWPEKVMKKVKAAEEESEEEEEVEEVEEEEEEEEVMTSENLSSINEYIRNKYFYCIYCTSGGQNIEELISFCPGPEMEDHDLD